MSAPRPVVPVPTVPSRQPPINGVLAAISIDYLCLALGGTLLAGLFRRPDTVPDRASPATDDRDPRP